MKVLDSVNSDSYKSTFAGTVTTSIHKEWRIDEHINGKYCVVFNNKILGIFESERNAIKAYPDITFLAHLPEKPKMVNTDERIFRITNTDFETYLCNIRHILLADLPHILEVFHLWNYEWKPFNKIDLKFMIEDNYKGRLSRIE